jgi:hypothetical protein
MGPTLLLNFMNSDLKEPNNPQNKIETFSPHDEIYFFHPESLNSTPKWHISTFKIIKSSPLRKALSMHNNFTVYTWSNMNNRFK